MRGRAQLAGRCFYCDIEMIRHPSADNAASKDHLVAKKYMRQMGSLSGKWRELNSIPCCIDCNNYKGSLRALDWLVIMPSPGANRVANRLLLLGCSREAIAAAMDRRVKCVSA